MEAAVERAIDANLNRLGEGLRVIEDIFRYIFDDRELASRTKELRHSLRNAYNLQRVSFRDIEGGVLKESTKSEMARENLQSVLVANFSRCEESSRVLEELFKLSDAGMSALFKDIRYSLYALEKRSYESFFDEALQNSTSNSR